MRKQSKVKELGNRRSYIRRFLHMLLYALIGAAAFIAGNMTGSWFIERNSVPSVKDFIVKLKQVRNAPTPTPNSEQTQTAEMRSIMIENRIVSIPAQTDSDELKAEFAQTIYSAAKDTGTISIESCSLLSPNVVKISQKTFLSIKNTSKDTHSIGVGAEEISVPAGQSGQLNLTSLSGSGIFGLHCDSISPAAFIWVQ